MEPLARHPSHLAKITAPQTSGTVVRDRLFSLLDEDTRRPVLWVGAPAGSGKTTLVASYLEGRRVPSLWYQCDEGDADLATFFHYMGLAVGQVAPRDAPLPSLTPEYLAGVSTFTRKFFETVFDRLLTALAPPEAGPGIFIVLDNYQDVPVSAPFHEMIAIGLDLVPPGVKVVLISRDGPPAALARLQANDKLGQLAAEKLRFTRGESSQLVRGRVPGLDGQGIEAIHVRAEGWAAGIILLLEQARIYGPGTAADPDLEMVFDYFAGQILEPTAPATRRFLLETAFLPTIGVPFAERLTGMAAAGHILAELCRHNYFTERLVGNGGDYRYHPLFRDFLMARAVAEMEAAELAMIRGRAARILSESGETEDAAALFADAGDWDGLVRLLTDWAGRLVREGRTQTLERFLRRLPQDTLAAHPSLLYWLGLCRMPFDIEESRTLLERAFHDFNVAGNATWALAAWAAVVDSIITEHNDYSKLDPWLAWLDGLGDGLPALAPETERETVAYMLFGLTFRQPWHPRIGWWRERAEALLRTDPDPAGALTVGARLLMHYTFFGEIHQAEVLLRNVRPPASGSLGLRPLALVQWEVIRAIYAVLGSGSVADCLDAVKRGLRLSREHGIRHFEPMLLYYGAVSAALAGDEAGADHFLDEMVALKAGFNAMHQVYYLSALAWRDLLRGDFRAAGERMATVLSVTEGMGHTVNAMTNHVGLAQALFELGEKERAQAHLDQGRRLIGADSHWFEHAFLSTEAYFSFREGREEEGLASIGKALALGRRTGVTSYVYWRPAVASLLCTKALAAGIERDYVQGLIRRQHLTPDPSCPAPEGWPWRLAIHTLGGFGILTDGEPLEFSRKTPRKPLELLKVLIAFGGRGVPVERVTDALWPDADGDLASKALETTLSRLRRLLGVDQCILSSARQLTLDPRSCWVDSLALEEVLGRSAASRGDELPRLFRQAASLYQGPFLPADRDREWTVVRDEQLKNRFLSLVVAAAAHLQGREEWQSAADCYLKGLEADELVEGLYARLMLCYQKLGRRSEAVQLYRRCRHVLQTQLGIAPSPGTEAVYASLL